MNKNRDSYDSKRKFSGLHVPNTYTGHRHSELSDGQSVGGVLYEPSFRGAVANAAVKDREADAYPGKTPAAVVESVTATAAEAAAASATALADRTFVSGMAAIERNTSRADEIANKLVAVLELEATLYQDASDISAKKTDVIVHGKIEDLDSLVKAEQAIILKIGKLEDEREKIVEALSDELELNLEGVTLSDINSRLGRESYSRLDSCQKSLAHTLGGLKNSNDTNAQLIQNALDYVNFSVNLLTTNQNTGNNYSQDGADEAGKQRRNIFDVKL